MKHNLSANATAGGIILQNQAAVHQFFSNISREIVANNPLKTRGLNPHGMKMIKPSYNMDCSDIILIQETHQIITISLYYYWISFHLRNRNGSTN